MNAPKNRLNLSENGETWHCINPYKVHDVFNNKLLWFTNNTLLYHSYFYTYISVQNTQLLKNTLF